MSEMIPHLDPRVKYVGSSWLRGLNMEAMKALSGAYVIQDADAEPVVVILPYQTYLKIQEVARDAEFPPLSINDAVRNERETRGLRPKGDTKR